MSEGDWKFLWRTIGFVAMVILCGGLFLPSMGTPREAVRRSETQNDLKQIGFSIINYTTEDNFARMPPLAIVDEDGKPLLSWRVLLLPQLEQSELFEQFDLTKPWDSPENLPLVEQMPEILASPNDRDAAKEGKTPYKAIISDDPRWNTAWGNSSERMRMSMFRDGMSNTAMVVEDLTKPVIWTKPEDITPGEYLKTLGHGQWTSKYFFVVFADGSVVPFKDPTEEEILPLLYADDGKLAQW